VKVADVLGVTLSELLSDLEVNGPGGPRRPAKGTKSHRTALRTLDIQKLVRQLRVQQGAAERTLSLLEGLTDFDSPAAPAMRSRRRKRSTAKK
jgi:hypothetical protein